MQYLAFSGISLSKVLCMWRQKRVTQSSHTYTYPAGAGAESRGEQGREDGGEEGGEEEEEEEEDCLSGDTPLDACSLKGIVSKDEADHLHTYIHTYITYIQTYIHTPLTTHSCRPVCRPS